MANHVVIKPSGVPYDQMLPEHMVVVDLDGNVVEGELRPSSDTPTHVMLYKHFAGVRGITHTHSPQATAFAQARSRDSLPGDDPRRPFLGTCTGDSSADSEQEVPNRVRREHGARDCGAVQGTWTRCRCPRCWSPATRRLPGARVPPNRSANAVALEAVAAMARATLPAAQRCATVGIVRTGKTLSAQAWSWSLLRTEVDVRGAERILRDADRRQESSIRQVPTTGLVLILTEFREVTDFNSLEVWFVTGSQHLYGPEVLKQVEADSQQIVAA